MSVPPKLPVNALDRFTQSPSKQPDSRLAETAKANPESVAVPIGVLEVPIGVWGSRRVESNSGQSERIEVFAEDTCTVIVFPQGAVIRLSAGVGPGQLIMIANRKSGQIMLCRVVKVRTYPNIMRLCRNRVLALRNRILGLVLATRDVDIDDNNGVGSAVDFCGFLEQRVSEGSGLYSGKRGGCFSGCSDSSDQARAN